MFGKGGPKKGADVTVPLVGEAESPGEQAAWTGSIPDGLGIAAGRAPQINTSNEE